MVAWFDRSPGLIVGPVRSGAVRLAVEERRLDSQFFFCRSKLLDREVKVFGGMGR